jgi:hypothetical protein
MFQMSLFHYLTTVPNSINNKSHVASLRDARGERSEFKIQNSKLMIPINKFRGL